MTTDSVKQPRQIPFIIGNEACERFSFYGMRNILVVFLTDYLLTTEVPDAELRGQLAKAHFHDFAAFYWAINFGSLFASLFIPKVLKVYGPTVAFGIPGILMLLATIIFWLGRKRYVNVPPSGPNPDAFSKVLWTALRGGWETA